MTRHLAIFVAVVLLSTAACSRPRFQAASGVSAQEELDKLQGTWRIQSSWWNGAQEPEVARSVTILFEGNRFIVLDRDGNRMEETIELLSNQDPKGIDRWGNGKGRAPGIYALEGDTFTWCSAGAGNTARPTSFSSNPGSRQSLMVLRRQKN